MGAEQVTVLNLEVLEAHPARGLILVAGPVPGAREGLVKIRYSAQSLEAARKREPQAPAPQASAEEGSASKDELEPAATEASDEPAGAGDDAVEGEAPDAEDAAASSEEETS
jgi:large subunit ribosomal protein L3